MVDAEHVDHWWLCGPHGMVGDARDLLTELGVPTERIHQELFYVDDVPPTPVRGDEETVIGLSSEVTIVLDGRTTTLTLSRDVPVLDSAQKVRGDLPFACKGGVCGTCRARVTDGEVEMRRNYALEPNEVEAGYVLTCQTIPLSDAVRSTTTPERRDASRPPSRLATRDCRDARSCGNTRTCLPTSTPHRATSPRGL
jgi:ring-1,2-phenylacetyl-CoA epoxidase subunit PaaE